MYPIGPEVVRNKNILELDPLDKARLIIDKSHGVNLKTTYTQVKSS